MIRPIDALQIKTNAVKIHESEMSVFNFQFLSKLWAKLDLAYSTAQMLQSSIVDTLKQSETFIVREEICTLISTASESLPPEALYREDVFCPRGLVIMEKPYMAKTIEGEWVGIHALSWVHMPRIASVVDQEKFQNLEAGSLEMDDRGGATIYEFSNLEGIRGDKNILPSSLLWIMDIDIWTYGRQWRRRRKEEELPKTIKLPRLVDEDQEKKRKWILTLWRLIRQKIIITERQKIERQAKRLAARNDIQTEIQVIRLREQVHASEDGDGDGIEWSHRWMVRGHWRDQWYPRKTRHEKIWVNPYVKGPEDKPLIVKNRVFQVER